MHSSVWSAQNVYGTQRRTVDYPDSNEAMTVAAGVDVFFLTRGN